MKREGRFQKWARPFFVPHTYTTNTEHNMTAVQTAIDETKTIFSAAVKAVNDAFGDDNYAPKNPGLVERFIQATTDRAREIRDEQPKTV